MSDQLFAIMWNFVSPRRFDEEYESTVNLREQVRLSLTKQHRQVSP